MASILLRKVNFTYAEKGGSSAPVYADFSLTLKSPRVVSVLGTNGVGKTTVLRLIAGLLQPDQGSVEISQGSRIGYVPQSNPVFPWLRVEDDIALPLEVAGVSQNERRQFVANLTREFSVQLPLKRRSNALSGGQRQLVNVLRALVGPRPPEILLLDEPFASLDPFARLELADLLQKVYEHYHPLILVSTHELEVGALVADEVIILSGRPITTRSAKSFPVPLSRPRTREMQHESEFQRLLGQFESEFEPKQPLVTSPEMREATE